MTNATFRISETKYRPALILERWSDDNANLLVFVDGVNDDDDLENIPEARASYPQKRSDPDNPASCTVWATSVYRGDGIGQWQEAE